MNATKNTSRTPGSSTDFVEILGSLILDRVGFNDRLAFAREETPFPSAEFPLSIVPNRPALAEAINTMFGVAATANHDTMGEWATEIADCWDKLDSRVIRFSTSGSTGQPTIVKQDLTLLMQEVETLAEIFKGRSRVVSFVPRHHIYGFIFSILLPARMGVECVCHPSPPTPGVFDLLEDGDLGVGFPLFWEKLVENGGQFTPGVHGVTSSGPCPKEVVKAVCEAGVERMTEVYGATETGGLGYRHDPDHCYELMRHWDVENLDQISRIIPSEGERRTYCFQDHVRWDTPRCFIPVGRKDKAEQVGGVNVYPEKVKTALLEHPGVKECAVRMMRQDEGNRLKAFIVWEAGGKTEFNELRQWLKEKVNRAEIPGGWTSGTKLPTNTMGKQQDW